MTETYSTYLFGKTACSDILNFLKSEPPIDPTEKKIWIVVSLYQAILFFLQMNSEWEMYDENDRVKNIDAIIAHSKIPETSKREPFRIIGQIKKHWPDKKTHEEYLRTRETNDMKIACYSLIALRNIRNSVAHAHIKELEGHMEKLDEAPLKENGGIDYILLITLWLLSDIGHINHLALQDNESKEAQEFINTFIHKMHSEFFYITE